VRGEPKNRLVTAALLDRETITGVSHRLHLRFFVKPAATMKLDAGTDPFLLSCDRTKEVIEDQRKCLILGNELHRAGLEPATQ